MEIRDYLRMLRHGWPAILVIAAMCVALAGIYLALAPRRYDATTVLFVSANHPSSIEELQAGNTFASYQVTTYAQIIDSATVLAPVAAQLRPQLNVDDLVGMVTATVRPETTLIDVTVSGDDPAQVAAVANAAGVSASRVLPALQPGGGGTALVSVQQIRTATEPTKASSPRVKHVLAAGLVIGLFVGLAGTLTFQTIDTRIRRLHDVRQLSELPVLAVLPRPRRAHRSGLVVRDAPGDPAVEAYRALRANLRSVEPTSRNSLVVSEVTGSGDGARVPANLAWAVAQTGRRVLLLDLDLRRSSVGELFGLPAGPGASKVLRGRADLAEVAVPVGPEGLRVVVSGIGPDATPELLGSAALGRLLAQAEASFDQVVVHVAPVLDHTDAAEVSVAAGAVLLSVPVGKARAQDLAMALTALANVRVTPLGLVLSRATHATLDRGGSRSPRRPSAPPRQPAWDVDLPVLTTKESS